MASLPERPIPEGTRTFLFADLRDYTGFVERQYLDPPYHRKRVGMNHLAFAVAQASQIDALADRLRERKVPLLYGGPRAGRTTYAVFFEDPDRIKIEVVARAEPKVGITPPESSGRKP